MRLFQHANYAFVEKRRIAYLASAIAILVGFAAMAFNVATLGSWQNYGVDFTGGVLVQVRFSGDVEAGEIREALGGMQASSITRFGEDNEYTIRAPIVDDAEVGRVGAEVTRLLEEAFGAGNFEVVRTDVVGPKIGAELQRRAALAILLALLVTLVYIAVRFEFRFGISAVITTFHDVLIPLGIIAIFQVEIALTTVAALLTIAGYSLNDTIVIFDRIRENLNRKGGRREDSTTLIDRSINEVLPRAVLTTGSTVAMLAILLILGGPVIREFTAVLVLGVMVGAFSSIFLAAPILVDIEKRLGVKEPGEKKPKRAPATV